MKIAWLLKCRLIRRNSRRDLGIIFFSPCISNTFGMFLRQQTNCSVARSKTLLLLANEVEQDLEEKYTFLIGLQYHINFLVESFSVSTTSKWSLCKLKNAVGGFCLSLFYLFFFFLGWWEWHWACHKCKLKAVHSCWRYPPPPVFPLWLHSVNLLLLCPSLSLLLLTKDWEMLHKDHINLQ